MQLSKHILNYREKQTRTLLINEKINFTNVDIMNYAIGALQWKLPGASNTLIRPWFKVVFIF